MHLQVLMIGDVPYIRWSIANLIWSTLLRTKEWPMSIKHKAIKTHLCKHSSSHKVRKIKISIYHKVETNLTREALLHLLNNQCNSKVHLANNRVKNHSMSSNRLRIDTNQRHNHRSKAVVNFNSLTNIQEDLKLSWTKHHRCRHNLYITPCKIR